ncbi:type II secretion system protein [Candidatus Saccharibacteria bacterium]|nr:type II secretion system protein [Candidatus Saccharibacteria bacterium]MBQ9016703.1 type II secretion system protein [Candidatus Saccharibacteria bacterium]
MKNLRSKSGFTILELALSMAFLSFLLLAIGIVTVQLMQIYQKGVTLKTVNNNGRELVDEFTRTISGTLYTPPEEDSSFAEAVYVQPTASILRSGTDSKAVPAYGAFCAGNYSYIWNTGYALNLTDETEIENFRARLVGYDEDINLLRLDDPGRAVCKNRDQNLFTGGSNPTELFPESKSELALYDLVVYEPSYHEHTGHALFSVSFILGTLSGGVDITLPGNYCTSMPDGFATDFAYCSVNKFNFAVRATGGS